MSTPPCRFEYTRDRQQAMFAWSRAVYVTLHKRVEESRNRLFHLDFVVNCRRCAKQNRGNSGRPRATRCEAWKHHVRGMPLPLPEFILAADALWTGSANGVHGRAPAGPVQR